MPAQKARESSGSTSIKNQIQAILQGRCIEIAAYFAYPDPVFC
jgi:hypothetical protein